ncbi:dipeptide/oligopeptide/nickel ABC transporter permease/ATP-binding protein [Microbacterium sp.]|uniref:dipeptide/oligopeptide/nickel ABC transporter permease/ATP-binding protein n=1 Tax=Microbacterium sp. TaxID=51671 RepID=UPI003342B2BD
MTTQTILTPRTRAVPAVRRRRRTAMTVVSLTMLLVLVLLAVLGPMVLGAAAARTDVHAANLAASAEHWFGTDALGRDIFARVVTATRLSLLLAVSAVLLGFGVGVPLGAVTALLPARAAAALARVIDTLVAFPPLLLSIVLAVIFGLGAHSAVIAIGAAYAPYFARLARNLASQVADADYISASRMLGVRRWRLLARHVFPNVGETLLLNGASAIGSALLAFAALSFLGLGVQQPDYDWGKLLSTGLDSIYISPAAALGPAAFLVFAGVTFNFLGESLAKRLARRPQLARRVRRGIVPAASVDEATRVEGDTVLSVRDLRVSVETPAGARQVVRGIDLDIREREIVGIVGESGSGKSITALSLTGLQPLAADVRFGSISLAGSALSALAAKAQRDLLGREVAYVFQDPMSYMNPALRVGTQLSEGPVAHRGIDRRAASKDAVAQLHQVGISAPARRAGQYPHELSGGMRQRAMIAMALMNRPRLLIADEPTTALDVTVQSQVLRTLRGIRDDDGVAIVLISHDIGVIGELCDRVLVMYAGEIVEELAVGDLASARHPYTRALLAATPSLAAERTEELASIPGRPPVDPGAVEGCAFAARCPFATEICRTAPRLGGDGGRRVACHHPVSAETTDVTIEEVAR